MAKNILLSILLLFTVAACDSGSSGDDSGAGRDNDRQEQED